MATVLITGSNRGIGLEFCRTYETRGDRVLAVCRTPSRELAALRVRVIAGVDITEDGDLERLRTEVANERIDILLNNAGLLVADTLASTQPEQVRRQFEVNALAPLRVVQTLVSNLAAGSKIAIITSRMGSMGDNASGGYYGYRMSKAAVNAVGRSLAIDLKDQGIAVGVFHPGYVRTQMTGGNGDVTPAESATRLVARVDELTLESTGSFVHANGESLPW